MLRVERCCECLSLSLSFEILSVVECRFVEVICSLFLRLDILLYEFISLLLSWEICEKRFWICDFSDVMIMVFVLGLLLCFCSFVLLLLEFGMI